MSVHIIIDGYNLIRQSPSLSLIDQQDLQMGRDELINRLATYKRMKAHQITVVFDGTHAPGFFPKNDRVRGIRIKFSQTGQSADAVIKRMVTEKREKAVVVSSDREILDHAAAHGAAAIPSPEFEDRMAMATVMEAKGVEEADESSGWKPTTQKKGPSRRLSRKARKIRVKLKKL